ncbi:ATP-binding protein [Trebonia kvetii]|uniref:ATP-binding protein n=1 Tax=Trebonia kvetii TaxID=2480626 RepID=A0A6P2BN33_9ACTN|nr:ATP-binding protein [Trebonia kvetii]TVY99930.1 ATP-binding protein [Trebonia kvetii]
MGEPIVGRGDELAQLRAALVAASGGAGRLVLVSGEPGIGKTRLAASLADMAAQYEVPAAAGGAIDDPGMPPLWPWHAVSRSVPPLAAMLDGTAGSAGGAQGSADSGSERFAMFAAASRALADAARERGLLVVLEDLHWADRTSLLLLRHLTGELSGSRLLVVATFRETAEKPLAGLLPALLRGEGTRLIRLTGLPRPEIAQWLRRLGTSGDVDDLAGRLRARTAGNPLFVRMLIEHGAAAGADDEARVFPSCGTWPWPTWTALTARNGSCSTRRACSVSGSIRRCCARSPGCPAPGSPPRSTGPPRSAS